MISAKNAIAAARAMLGTPYSEMDCIALIRAVIRQAPGGAKDYRCEGTNWLWRSIGNSGKYRHLTWRQEDIGGAAAGMLAFKRSGEDVHHVGLITGEGTVIHSSSVRGCVVETALDDTWHLLGEHRYIEKSDIRKEREEESGDAPGESAPPAWRTQTTLINRADGYALTLTGDWRIAED